MKAKPFRLWRIDGKFAEGKREKRKQKETQKVGDW